MLKKYLKYLLILSVILVLSCTESNAGVYHAQLGVPFDVSAISPSTSVYVVTPDYVTANTKIIISLAFNYGVNDTHNLALSTPYPVPEDKKGDIPITVFIMSDTVTPEVFAAIVNSYLSTVPVHGDVYYYGFSRYSSRGIDYIKACGNVFSEAFMVDGAFIDRNGGANNVANGLTLKKIHIYNGAYGDSAASINALNTVLAQKGITLSYVKYPDLGHDTGIRIISVFNVTNYLAGLPPIVVQEATGVIGNAIVGYLNVPANEKYYCYPHLDGEYICKTAGDTISYSFMPVKGTSAENANAEQNAAAGWTVLPFSTINPYYEGILITGDYDSGYPLGQGTYTYTYVDTPSGCISIFSKNVTFDSREYDVLATYHK